MKNSDSGYIADIRSQPTALRQLALDPPDYRRAAALATAAPRIILTGMGASHAALLPAWRHLAQAGLPAWHIETAELLSLNGFLQGSELIIAASQSGRSAELLSLADMITPSQRLIAITNQPASPLAERAEQTIDIRAGEENAVSTKTYLNSVWAATCLARAITNTPQDRGEVDMAAEALHQYLNSWRERVDDMKERIGLPERTVIIGRESSFASALYGALIVKEAAKWQVEASTAAQFRHGPLEMTDPMLCAFVIGGEGDLSRSRNLRLAQDVTRFGGRVFWVDSGPAPDTLALDHPRLDGTGRIMAEALPFQLLSIAIAELTDIAPGVFRNLSKVTSVE